MASVFHPPSLRGLRLGLPDPAAAASVFRGVLGAARLRESRYAFAEQWIDLHAAPGDVLALRCDDLGVQRAHLARLGIEPLDGSALGCTPCLGLDALDTGACAVDLREAAPPVPAGEQATCVCGLELAVHAPERVALHWAQLFQARPFRDAEGLPAIALDGFELRFALAETGRTGATALDFAARDVEPLLRQATAQGLVVQREATHARFEAHGLVWRLRPSRQPHQQPACGR